MRRLSRRRLCKAAGKRKYDTALDVMLDNVDRPAMARAYLCRHCGFYHLTRRAP